MKNRPSPQELISISKSLGLKITEDYGTFNLHLDPQNGNGNVRAISFDDNITALNFSLDLNRDIEITLKSNKKKPLFFAYCLDGEFSLIVDEKNTIDIDKLKTAIISPTKGKANKILLKRSQNFKLNLLVIDQDQYFEKFMSGYYQADIKLEKLIESFNTIENNYHIGSYSLKITEQLRVLHADRKAGNISDFLFQEGIYHLILAYHIEQFYNKKQLVDRFTTLNDSELRVIGELSEYIVSNPELQHNIDALCRRAGMSPAKLQEGFKHLQGLTVLNYIRSVRLNKAESLLLNSDLNISEIVYSIGFTSRSYFCKIFRNKYKCTPKEYRKKIKMQVLKSVA